MFSAALMETRIEIEDRLFLPPVRIKPTPSTALSRHALVNSYRFLLIWIWENLSRNTRGVRVCL
jgi:hypothetical protein